MRKISIWARNVSSCPNLSAYCRNARCEWSMGSHGGGVWGLPHILRILCGYPRCLPNQRCPHLSEALRNSQTRRQHDCVKRMLTDREMVSHGIQYYQALITHCMIRSARWEPHPTTPPEPVVRHCNRGFVPNQECRGTGPVGGRARAWGWLGVPRLVSELAVRPCGKTTVAVVRVMSLIVGKALCLSLCL